jgi:hypothetical protein
LGVKPEDSEKDKAFKQTLGKIAMHFVRNKAEHAFRGSKYRDQMLTQKNIVKLWLEKIVIEA